TPSNPRSLTSRLLPLPRINHGVSVSLQSFKTDCSCSSVFGVTKKCAGPPTRKVVWYFISSPRTTSSSSNNCFNFCSSSIIPRHLFLLDFAEHDYITLLPHYIPSSSVCN